MRKFLVATAAAALGVVAVAPSAASAHHHQPDRTLADVLLADSGSDDENGFDNRWYDYDIVTQAVLLFPDLVEAASNPDADLTVFLPRDRAFQRLVRDITGERLRSEADVFAAVASLGADTVKTVLQYHIVPAKVSYRDALRSNGATIPTLLDGATFDVKVKRFFFFRYIKLVDADTNDRNPIVFQPNIGGEASNGFAHGINRVLRPIDLP